MNVSGCMFCKHAEGNKINQKMKKNNLMLRCGKGENNHRNSRANTCEKSRFSWMGCSKTFNCEFFQKSKVAVSELAGSVEENLRSLLDKNYKLINEKIQTFY